MDDLSLDFASEQVDRTNRVRQFSTRYGVMPSESDTIEYLIVPVLSYVYGSNSEIVRASRDARSKSNRRWDVMVRHPCFEDGWAAAVECKSLVEPFKPRKTVWSDGNRLREEIEKNPDSLDGKGDPLLQIWRYLQSSRFVNIDDATAVMWTNGLSWVFIKSEFRQMAVDRCYNLRSDYTAYYKELNVGKTVEEYHSFLDNMKKELHDAHKQY